MGFVLHVCVSSHIFAHSVFFAIFYILVIHDSQHIQHKLMFFGYCRQYGPAQTALYIRGSLQGSYCMIPCHMLNVIWCAFENMQLM